jgi:hypothetical protein
MLRKPQSSTKGSTLPPSISAVPPNAGVDNRVPLQKLTPFPATRERCKVQAIDSIQRNPPPTTPGAQQFLPRRDRQVVAHAFHALNRSVRWLAKVNRVSEKLIEDIIRDERSSVFEIGVAEGRREASQPAVMFRRVA